MKQIYPNFMIRLPKFFMTTNAMSAQALYPTFRVRIQQLLHTSSTVHVIILLAIYLPVSLFLAYKTQGISYWGEGDYERHAEHYSAYLHGYNLLHYDFFKSYGLIDESTSSNPAKHPFVYIHGSSLAPRLFTFFMLWLGVESIYHQTLIFVIVTSIWVPLAYLALTKLFNSYVGFLATLLIATDYYSTLTASVTLYRGWHVVIFFYLLWASARLDFEKRSRGQYLHLGLAVFLAVSFELPFAALCLLIAAYVILLNSRSLIKTAIVLAIPVILTGAMIATQLTLYLGGITEVTSHIYSTFLYRLNLSEGSDDAESFYESRQIIFWPNKADPFSTLVSFIPDAASLFVEKNGQWLAGLVFLSNLFVLYRYLFKRRHRPPDGSFDVTNIPLAETNFNPAYFLLFALFAILLTTLIFPSVLGFYNSRSLPLVVFFVFLGVPFFLSYLQQKLDLSPTLWMFTFLLFWTTAQLQVYTSAPPSPDGLQQMLQRDYSGASIGVTAGAYPWQALWYAVKEDAYYFLKDEDAIRSAPTEQASHPADIFYYNPVFSYHSDRQELPEYIVIDTSFWPAGTLKNKVLDMPSVTVDAEYDRFMVLKLSDRTIPNE